MIIKLFTIFPENSSSFINIIILLVQIIILLPCSMAFCDANMEAVLSPGV